MSDEKKPFIPSTKGMTHAKPIEAEIVRATVGIEPMPAPKMGRPPTVTQTKTVTTTSSSGSELDHYIQPRGKELIDQLFALAFSPSTKDTVRLQVINSLLDRGFGRPTQKSESVSTVADLSSLHLEALKKSAK